MHILKTLPLVAVIGAGCLLSGCATRESVEHAQLTADQARSDAAGARSAADRAQSTADGATKTAQDAMASAQSANGKVDKVIADMQKRRNPAAHRKHRRHVAMAANQPNCPAPQQKTELKSHPQKAAALKLRAPHDKTARN